MYTKCLFSGRKSTTFETICRCISLNFSMFLGSKKESHSGVLDHVPEPLQGTSATIPSKEFLNLGFGPEARSIVFVEKFVTPAFLNLCSRFFRIVSRASVQKSLTAG